MGHAGKSEQLKTKDPLYALRHGAAHVMAQAVRRMYPDTKLAIGPPIEDGFYYDLAPSTAMTEADLPKIEAEMTKIIKESHVFQQRFMSKLEALKYFGDRGERFKVEIIQGLPDDRVSIYSDGEFVDLCEGPHVRSTAELNAVKLVGLAGAYWRGDERNPQLQRIYGTELFSFEELAGPGVVFYHPKGALVRSIIEDDLKQRHLARDYQLVATPHIFRSDLWKRSGHLEHYQDYMFLFEAEGQSYGLKPMNCPGHILLYEARRRSYRELPLRFFEFGTVYRHEKSGVLHGLLRVRGFTQDDAHLFLREDQLVEEIAQVLDFAFEVLRAFGLTDYELELSTRPEKFIGSPEAWAHAEEALRQALARRQLRYDIHEGEGAFYGPKIDIKIKDALGRSWQCGTIQCDFALPERFNLTYVGEDGKPARVIMVHRALLGSFERFFGMLIEHYAGALPVWLAPVQVVVVPISDKALDYARDVHRELRGRGLRVTVDERNEKMQAKIRDAQLQQVPYMAVVGPKEAAARQLAVRHRRDGDVGAMDVNAFAQRVQEEAQQRVT